MKTPKTTSIVCTLFMSASLAIGAGDWNWTLTPYGWLAGLDGNTGVRRLVAPVDLSPSDVIEDLSFTAMIALDANNDQWGVAGDLFYVNLDSSTPTAAGPVNSDVEQWIVSGVPYLRVASDEKATVDVGAGGRYMDTDLDLATPAGKRSGSKNWIDPIVMLRTRYALAEKVFLTLSGDIGGFGVGSDLTWQLAGSVGYALTDKVDLLLGYRHLDVDYEDDGFVYDIATSGFGVGVRIEL